MFDAATAAQRVNSFLGDSVIQEIFHERKMLYFNQWLKCDTPAAREALFAEARAFDSLGIALQAVADTGLHEEAQAQLERRSE